MKQSPKNRGSLLSSTSMLALCEDYDALARPALGSLALGSSVMSGAGLLAQFPQPDFVDFLFCVMIGFILYQIARIFWFVAFSLPFHHERNALLTYAFVAALGFSCYAGVAITANLSATAGQMSQELVEQRAIDDLANAGTAFATHVDRLRLVLAALEQKQADARALKVSEIAGTGPTGARGSGPVADAGLAAETTVGLCVKTLQDRLEEASKHIDAVSAAVVDLRLAQGDPDLSGPTRDAVLKERTAQAINAMRALMALDPARAVEAVASNIAAGVPRPSNALPSSYARIDEINAGMRDFADELFELAAQIESEAPTLPRQSTLSVAEQLLETAWRLPALTMAALLIDLAGGVAVGGRCVLYRSYFARRREEAANDDPGHLTLDDLDRVASFLQHMAGAQDRMASGSATRKPGRPSGVRSRTVKGSKTTPATKTPRKGRKAGPASDA